MQKAISPGILFLTMMTGLSSCSQSYTNKVIYTIDFAWLEGCETGKGDGKPVLISRQCSTDTIQLIFPEGGTSSSVYVYSASSDKPLRQDHTRAGEGHPSLDLTGLADGVYLAHMLACAIGGSFSIIIKTN
ncbi:MAG: hypothetical protein WDO16_25355 [Bacteroidota bacterium]